MERILLVVILIVGVLNLAVLSRLVFAGIQYFNYLINEKDSNE